MNFYNTMVNAYNHLLMVFPVQVHWLISLAIIMGFLYLFIALIRSNVLFVILLVLLLPFLLPVLGELLAEIWQFFVYIMPHTHP